MTNISNTTDNMTARFIMTKTTKANGEHTYQVVEVATGKIHATRNSRRDYVACLFQILKEGQTKPHGIDNGFGRMDLAFKAISALGEIEKNSLIETGVTTDGISGIAALHIQPAPLPEDDQDTGANIKIQDENSLDKLAAKVKAANDQIQERDQEPKADKPVSSLLEGYRTRQAEQLANQYNTYERYMERTGKEPLGFWDYIDNDPDANTVYSKPVQERAMEMIQERKEQDKTMNDVADTLSKITGSTIVVTETEKKDSVAEEFYKRYAPSMIGVMEEQLKAWETMATEMLGASTPEDTRKAILQMAQENGTQGKQLEETHADNFNLRENLNEMTKLRNNAQQIIKNHVTTIMDLEHRLEETEEENFSQAQRIQELEELLQVTEKQIQETMDELNNTPDPGEDTGMATSEVLAAIQEEQNNTHAGLVVPDQGDTATQQEQLYNHYAATLKIATQEEMLYNHYIATLKEAGYQEALILSKDIFVGLLHTGSKQVKAAGWSWQLNNPEEQQAKEPQERPVAERESNLARRLQLLEDLRILEECGLIRIGTNDRGEPYLEVPTRTPDEGDKEWLAKQAQRF